MGLGKFLLVYTCSSYIGTLPSSKARHLLKWRLKGDATEGLPPNRSFFYFLQVHDWFLIYYTRNNNYDYYTIDTQ